MEKSIPNKLIDLQQEKGFRTQTRDANLFLLKEAQHFVDKSQNNLDSINNDINKFAIANNLQAQAIEE